MRKSLIGAVFAMVAIVVSGCGGNDMANMGSGTTSSTAAAAPGKQAVGNNAADATFATEMVAHHTQAIDMATMAPTRSTNPKVLDLAKRVEAAQDPEIQKMNEWLKAWGVTSTSMPGMDHGSMPGGSMPGMMTDAEMASLEKAKGAEFDKMWLDMMIKHHEGAVEMAKTELEKGSNTEAKKLAQEIIDAQQKEITEMKGLLTSV